MVYNKIATILSRNFPKILCCQRPLCNHKQRIWIQPTCTFGRGRFPTDIQKLDGLTRKENSAINVKVDKDYDPKLYNSENPQFYNALNFEVTGFDMVDVEAFSQFIHKFLKSQKVDLLEVYAKPTKETSIKYLGNDTSYNFEEKSLMVSTKLLIHTRIVQIAKTKAHLVPLFVQRFAKDISPGLNLSIKEYTAEEHESRFEVNMELLELQDEVEKLQAQRN